ncbi:hypothetical protein [Streptomyces eurythermus]
MTTARTILATALSLVFRYAKYKRMLLDDETFISTGGVALNSLGSPTSQGTALCDGEDHSRRRSHLEHRLTPERCARWSGHHHDDRLPGAVPGHQHQRHLQPSHSLRPVRP